MDLASVDLDTALRSVPAAHARAELHPGDSASRITAERSLSGPDRRWALTPARWRPRGKLFDPDLDEATGSMPSRQSAGGRPPPLLHELGADPVSGKWRVTVRTGVSDPGVTDGETNATLRAMTTPGPSPPSAGFELPPRSGPGDRPRRAGGQEDGEDHHPQNHDDKEFKRARRLPGYDDDPASLVNSQAPGHAPRIRSSALERRGPFQPTLPHRSPGRGSGP